MIWNTMARDVLALLDSARVSKKAAIMVQHGGYVTFALWRLAKERALARSDLLAIVSAIPMIPGRDATKTAEKVFAEGSQVVRKAWTALIPRPIRPKMNRWSSKSAR